MNVFLNKLFKFYFSLLSRITAVTTLAEGVDPNKPEKLMLEKEKDNLAKFKGVLQAFLHDKSKLQLMSIYSLQMFCYNNNNPKGMSIVLIVYLFCRFCYKWC